MENGLKRYVFEFANDELRVCTTEGRAKIERILTVYKRGLITSYEAVKRICEHIED